MKIDDMKKQMGKDQRLQRRELEKIIADKRESAERERRDKIRLAKHSADKNQKLNR